MRHIFPLKPKTAPLHDSEGCSGKNNEKKEINALDFGNYFFSSGWSSLNTTAAIAAPIRGAAMNTHT